MSAAEAPPNAVTRRDLVAVGALSAVLIAIRIGLLLSRMHDPGFAWQNLDHYIDRQAGALLEGGHWHWSLAAVQYEWGGSNDWILPPLYPIFLSLFASGTRVAEFPAAIGQIVLSSLTPLAIFWLVSRLHTVRAAFLAAVISAGTQVLSPANSFLQEFLWVPLLVAAFAA